MISLARVLESKQILVGKKYFNLLLGSINSSSADMSDLTYLVSKLPDNSTWAATGIGQFQLPINMAALIMGGNIRIGLEDSIYYDFNKRELATNVQLIQRIKRIAKEIYRPIATPEEARLAIGL